MRNNCEMMFYENNFAGNACPVSIFPVLKYIPSLVISKKGVRKSCLWDVSCFSIKICRLCSLNGLVSGEIEHHDDAAAGWIKILCKFQ